MPRSPRKSRAETTRESPQRSAAPRVRTHAFTGCATCRERHVKCDLGQPWCRNCTRLNIPCEGYARKYSWLPQIFKRDTGRGNGQRSLRAQELVENVEESQSSRRVLFSDAERAGMVEQMKLECGSMCPDLDLDQILRKLDQGQETDDLTRIGPFGVLYVSKVAPSTKSLSPESKDYMEDGALCILSTPELNIAPAEVFQHPPEKCTSNGDSLGLEAASALVSLTSKVNSKTQEYCFDASDSLSPYNDEVDSLHDDLAFHECQQNVTWDADFMNCVTVPEDSEVLRLPQALQDGAPSILHLSNHANLDKIPAEARSLLDYYSSRIIYVMTMSPAEKPPWKVIHLPCAMSALAEIMVHGEARSSAKMALFYALLSISSFHMSLTEKKSTERSLYWYERGISHKLMAEIYLKSALDPKVPKVARGKYKEVLMSLLSMVTIGVFSGNMQECHGYLTVSERVIRKYGLPKPVKSQKVSKLHHIFSFLRIIEETTIRTRKPFTSLESNDRAALDSDELESSPSGPSTPQSIGKFDWIDDEEGGIEDPEDSLFVSIYQIPTTLFALLSQTSMLFRQLPVLGALTPELARRCQIVEDRIFDWRPPDNLTLKYSTPDPSAIPAHLVAAMHHALIVHFQRQIRRTDPRVLQKYIISAADHLIEHENLKTLLQVRTTAFPWPSFIVGCEAYEASARAKVEEYLDLVRDYNVGSLVEMEKVIREVWRRQDEGMAERCWDDVLRAWGLRIVLT